MQIIEGEVFRELYYQVLAEVMDGKEVNSRVGKTRELHPVQIILRRPKSRALLLMPGRGNNPFASLAEVVWVFSGHNNIDWLLPFLPRAKDYSDDGVTWRAGYGSRLRSSSGFDDNGNVVYIDQIKWVFKELRKDPESRRAVMTIWNPAKECTAEKTLDMPCSSWLHFMIRDGKLDLELVMRSNDAFYGFGGINVYEFTVLQEILANMLKVQVGTYYHYVSSLHLYENQWQKVDKVIRERVQLQGEYYPFVWSFYNSGIYNYDFDATFKQMYLEIENWLREGKEDLIESVLCGDFGCNNETKHKVIGWLIFYLCVQECNENETLFKILHKLQLLDGSDLAAECMFWFYKKINFIEPNEIGKFEELFRIEMNLEKK